MHYIDTALAVGAPPASLGAGAVAPPAYFKSANALLGTKGTTGDQDYHNALMMEPINLILAAGIVPAKGVWTQVRDAVLTLIERGAGQYLPDTSGAANQITVTMTPAPANYAAIEGVEIRVALAHTNTAQAVNINVNGFGNIPVINPDGTLPAIGALPVNAIMVGVVDETGTHFLVTGLTTAPSNQRTYTYAGNPNGNVAGRAGTANGLPPDLCWDTTDNLLYVCTTTGNAGAAVWNLANGGSLTTSGGASGYIYSKQSNGLILQSNLVSASGVSTAITFPNAFPNTCVHVLAIEGAPDGWAGTTPTIYGTKSPTATGFSLYCVKWTGSGWGSPGTATCRYLAIGY